MCKLHRQGVVRSQLRTHLRSSHPEIPTAARNSILEAASTFQDWADMEEEVFIPTEKIQPIPHLPIFRDCNKCVSLQADDTPCPSIQRKLKHIQEHCRHKHGWVNTRVRGRAPKGYKDNTSKMWVEGVWSQKFQPTGRLGRLFEVSDMAEADTEVVVDEEEKTKRAMNQLFAETTSALETVDKETFAKIHPDDDRHVFHRWLNRAGWARHLRGLDRRWLLTLGHKPKKREKALAQVCWAVEMVIWKAQQASCTEVVGFPAMNYISRREMGDQNNEKPFNARQTGKTMQRYSGWWLAIIRYLWRTQHLPEMEPQADKGDDETGGLRGRRPHYRLTGRQLACLSRIEREVGQDRIVWDTREDEETDKDEEEEEDDDDRDDEDDSDGDGELDDEQELRLQRHVLDLLVSLLEHPLKDDNYKSPLLSGLAVLGVDTNCGWKSPMVYTPTLSAIVTVGKMLVLYSVVEHRKQLTLEKEKEGFARQDAEELAPSHFELVQEMADRFMTLTSYRGTPYPIDWVLRLRTYGRRIASDTNAEGVVQWVGDTLLFGHTQFSMSGLRSMIHGLLETTRQELQRDLLLLDVDTHGQLLDGATPLPAIMWDELVDNPAERKAGWNFIQDKRNTFGGVNGQTWLSNRVVVEKRLREAFVDVGATDPSVPGGRGVAWKAQAVQKYHKAMQNFRRDLLVLRHMSVGQPPRGTELVTVPYKNMPNGESRGTLIENGLMADVTSYHKGIGVSSKAKVIHRYLPQEVGELQLYYLWIVLPFWRMLQAAFAKEDPKEASSYIWEPMREKAWARPQRRKKRRRGDTPVATLEGEAREQRHSAAENGSTCFKTEQWGTNQIRRAIERVSLRALGTKLNIQIWRHSTKAIYRKYMKDKAVLKALIAANKDDDDEADEPEDIQTAHSSHVANGVYGRLNDESPFSTEAKRLSLQKVSIVWH